MNESVHRLSNSSSADRFRQGGTGRGRTGSRRPGWILLSALALGLWGCAAARGDRVDGAGGVPLENAWSYVYSCPDEYRFSVRVLEGSVVVNTTGETVELPAVPAASGARYADAGYVFWSRGDEALLETPVGEHAGCQAAPANSPWEDAALREVIYRAVGQEPGWYVEVVPDRHLLFVGDYGTLRVLGDPPTVARDDARGRTEYRASAGSSSLRLTVDEAPCIDTMSGEAFPTRARLTVDERTFDGCGHWLDDWVEPDETIRP